MRRFAIEPALLPLLRTMHAEGPVVAMRQQKWWAADLRKHLEAAGIKHEALDVEEPGFVGIPQTAQQVKERYADPVRAGGSA